MGGEGCSEFHKKGSAGCGSLKSMYPIVASLNSLSARAVFAALNLKVHQPTVPCSHRTHRLLPPSTKTNKHHKHRSARLPP